MLPVNETMVSRKQSESTHTHAHTERGESDDTIIPDARLLHGHSAAAGCCLPASPQRSTQRRSCYRCPSQEQLSPPLHLRDVYTGSLL